MLFIHVYIINGILKYSCYLLIDFIFIGAYIYIFLFLLLLVLLYGCLSIYWNLNIYIIKCIYKYIIIIILLFLLLLNYLKLWINLK